MLSKTPRLLLAVLCASGLLLGFTAAAGAQEVPAATIPQSELVQRAAPGPLTTLEADPDYGRLYPYIGARLWWKQDYYRPLYGLADAAGRVVLDPVLMEVYPMTTDEGEDILLLTYNANRDGWPAGPQQIAAADGSWVTPLYDGTGISCNNGRLVRQYSRIGFDPETSSYINQPYFSIYDRAGTPILEGQAGLAYGYQNHYLIARESWWEHQRTYNYLIDQEGNVLPDSFYNAIHAFQDGRLLYSDRGDQQLIIDFASGAYLLDPDTYRYINPGEDGYLYVTNEDRQQAIYNWQMEQLCDYGFEIKSDGYNDWRSSGALYHIGVRDGRKYLLDLSTATARLLPTLGQYVGDDWQIDGWRTQELTISNGHVTRLFRAPQLEDRYANFEAGYLGGNRFGLSYRMQKESYDWTEEDRAQSYLAIYDALADQELLRLAGGYFFGRINEDGCIYARQLAQPQDRGFYLDLQNLEVLFGGSFEQIESLTGNVYQIREGDWSALRRFDGTWLLRIELIDDWSYMENNRE